MSFKAVKLFSTTTDSSSLLKLTGASDAAAALRILGDTLNRDSRLSDAYMVLRLHHDVEKKEQEGIYLFGDLSPERVELIARLATQIPQTLKDSLYISYPEAENFAEDLAEKLIRTYGRERLAQFEIRPVPRGGYIVCGLLLYALGKLTETGSRGGEAVKRPILLVDDAVFSGFRIRQTVESIQKQEPHREVHVAVLAAPESLCNGKGGVHQSFPITAAMEYQDQAPEMYGETYAQWKSGWESKSGEKVLWTGHPKTIVFSWSEPESVFINSVTDEIELAFRLYPPQRCFRNRFEGEDRGTVQLHEDSPSGWTAAPEVVAARIGENRIVVADFTENGEEQGRDCFLLEDTAADMWDILLRAESTVKAAEELAGLYDADPEEIRKDLEHFAASLKEQGLLVHE